jgi:hypothetical protein
MSINADGYPTIKVVRMVDGEWTEEQVVLDYPYVEQDAEQDGTKRELNPELRIDGPDIRLGDFLAAQRVVVHRATQEEWPAPGNVPEGIVIAHSEKRVVLKTREGVEAVLPLVDYLDMGLIEPSKAVAQDMEKSGPSVDGRLPNHSFTCRFRFYYISESHTPAND